MCGEVDTACSFFKKGGQLRNAKKAAFYHLTSRDSRATWVAKTLKRTFFSVAAAFIVQKLAAVSSDYIVVSAS